MMPRFIIEHLELRLSKWSALEYAHISKLVGKSNLLFTNIRSAAVRKTLSSYGKVELQSVADLELKGVCVLDPEAAHTLTPADAKRFSTFVFGGILGDDPPRERTKVELTNNLRNATARNLGKKQMTTDNAVAVVQEIVKGKRLEQLRFVDEPEIVMKPGESTILPYRYLVDKRGLPIIAPELLQHLAAAKTF